MSISETLLTTTSTVERVILERLADFLMGTELKYALQVDQSDLKISMLGAPCFCCIVYSSKEHLVSVKMHGTRMDSDEHLFLIRSTNYAFAFPERISGGQTKVQAQRCQMCSEKPRRTRLTLACFFFAIFSRFFRAFMTMTQAVQNETFLIFNYFC